MSLERKEMSFSRRRESQILHVSSSEAVTKKAALWATAMQLMARLCSARCATRIPRGLPCCAGCQVLHTHAHLHEIRCSRAKQTKRRPSFTAMQLVLSLC